MVLSIPMVKANLSSGVKDLAVTFLSSPLLSWLTNTYRHLDKDEGRCYIHTVAWDIEPASNTCKVLKMDNEDSRMSYNCFGCLFVCFLNPNSFESLLFLLSKMMTQILNSQ